MENNVSDSSSTSHPFSSSTNSQVILAEIRKQLDGKPQSLLSGFSSFPTEAAFETQEKHEQIILLLRRHFVTNMSWIGITVILLFVPQFISYSTILDFLPLPFQLMTGVLWYMLVMAYVLENALSWYFNVFIITDERIIDVDFYSLIYKHVSEMKIDRLEDVTYTQGGFLQSMLNCGNVIMQTAAEVPRVEFEMVPQPSQVVKVINQLILQEEQEKIENRIY